MQGFVREGYDDAQCGHVCHHEGGSHTGQSRTNVRKLAPSFAVERKRSDLIFLYLGGELVWSLWLAGRFFGTLEYISQDTECRIL